MTAVSTYAEPVPAEANATRQKLLAAGERLFATRGIHGAQLRDIVRAAGQANDSAIHYHFGSRDGLLAAICARHLAEMEPERERRLATQGDEPDITVMVVDLIRPAGTTIPWARIADFPELLAPPSPPEIEPTPALTPDSGSEIELMPEPEQPSRGKSGLEPPSDFEEIEPDLDRVAPPSRK
ncbi:MAG: TetR/AcrR family transcriptional regulator, partial [Actinobacteria bacterium]|nr:TetR/AcrR family transcriptional regulator [Actinomycetota bacterium]